MGPMFYLVQSHGALRPISAVILADWPHEFALAPFPRKGGCALGRRLCLPRLSPSAEACGAREKSLARNSRHLTVLALLLCCAVSDQVVDLLRRQLRQIGTSNR